MDRKQQERQKYQYYSAKDRAEKHEKGFEMTSINRPEGVRMFRFRQAKTYRLDILPYRVGVGNPFADEGFLHYERTYYTHNIPTADGFNRYCCSKRTFKKACFFCDFIARSRRDGSLDDKAIKKLSSQERQLFNLIDLDDADKGIQIMEFNWFQLGKSLDMKSKAKDKYNTFYALEDGYTVEVIVEEGIFDKRTVYPPADISFEHRPDYPESILEEVYCLDDLPKELSYEEMKALMEGGVVVEKKEDPLQEKVEKKSISPSPSVPKTEVKSNGHAPILRIGDVITHSKHGECDVERVSPDGDLVVLKDDQGVKHHGVPAGECSLVPTKDNQDRLAPKTPIPPSFSKPKPKEVEKEKDLDEEDSSDNNQGEDLMESNDMPQQPSRLKGKR